MYIPFAFAYGPYSELMSIASLHKSRQTSYRKFTVVFVLWNSVWNFEHFGFLLQKMNRQCVPDLDGRGSYEMSLQLHCRCTIFLWFLSDACFKVNWLCYYSLPRRMRQSIKFQPNLTSAFLSLLNRSYVASLIILVAITKWCWSAHNFQIWHLQIISKIVIFVSWYYFSFFVLNVKFLCNWY